MDSRHKRLMAGGIALAALFGGGQAAVAQGLRADLILYHGKVLTVDAKDSVRSAVVIRDGKIVETGADTLRGKYKAAKEIDLNGRTLLPGFSDTHIHPMAVSPRSIPVEKARSITEAQAMLRAKAAQLGKGEWITGFGWQESNLLEKRNITRADLDVATPDNPVMLMRAGGHSAVSNSLALKLAGVDRNTPDPKGGLIEHLPDGEPNGITREGYGIVGTHIPKDKWEGKWADMVVLPFDPLTADPAVILDGKVDMTFVAGKLVYDRATAK